MDTHDTVTFVDIKHEAVKQLRAYKKYLDSTERDIDDDADLFLVLQYINDLGYDVVLIFGSSLMIAGGLTGTEYFNRVDISSYSVLSFPQALLSAIIHFINFYFKQLENGTFNPDRSNMP